LIVDDHHLDRNAREERLPEQSVQNLWQEMRTATRRHNEADLGLWIGRTRNHITQSIRDSVGFVEGAGLPSSLKSQGWPIENSCGSAGYAAALRNVFAS